MFPNFFIYNRQVLLSIMFLTTAKVKRAVPLVIHRSFINRQKTVRSFKSFLLRCRIYFCWLCERFVFMCRIKLLRLCCFYFFEPFKLFEIHEWKMYELCFLFSCWGTEHNIYCIKIAVRQIGFVEFLWIWCFPKWKKWLIFNDRSQEIANWLIHQNLCSIKIYQISKNN